MPARRTVYLAKTSEGRPALVVADSAQYAAALLGTTLRELKRGSTKLERDDRKVDKIKNERGRLEVGVWVKWTKRGSFERARETANGPIKKK